MFTTHSGIEYARNKALRAVQTVIGVYLHANEVPSQVIALLTQYGISVGLESLETIMKRGTFIF